MQDFEELAGLPVLIEEELHEALSKLAVQKGLKLDELVAKLLRGSLEKHYPDFVPYKYPKADKLSDLTDFEFIALGLKSVGNGIPIEKCFEMMKQERASFENYKRVQNKIVKGVKE